jgi:hypothetical protein
MYADDQQISDMIPGHTLPPAREDVLDRIRSALLDSGIRPAAARNLIVESLRVVEGGRGFDPYNSAAGNPRDAWSRRRHSGA